MKEPPVKHRNRWALILAAGEGSRLHGLTRNEHGVAVPKQFCSLRGGPSLLQEALQRAGAVAPLQRICPVVAAQHREWWCGTLEYVPKDNVIVQPRNRGTGHGVLLPLLKIADRDPDAVVVVLPADHYFRDETTIAASLRHAAEKAEGDAESIYLLGIEPDEADTELGYIVPSRQTSPECASVVRFVEKPTEARARALIEHGALWNVFIMAASVRALLGLYDERFAHTIGAMKALNSAALEELYEGLGTVDFSKDILQGQEGSLRVIPMPRCGWTDLGTPQRIGAMLRRLENEPVSSAELNGGYFALRAHINLAQEYERLLGRRDYGSKFGHVDMRA